MSKEKVSKPGTVGTNMPAALKGDRDNEGPVSKNYEGKARNANPAYPYTPSSGNAQTVSDWTKDLMKKAREKAAEKKKEGK